LITVERCGPVRAVPIDNEKVSTLQPIIDRHIDKNSHLMTDEHRSYLSIGKQFLAHSYVNHSRREYSQGNVHNNTAESYASMFECARIGVFHYLSSKHLSRYLNEVGFRWDHRIPKEKTTKSDKKKFVIKPIPILDMLIHLIMRCSGIHLRRIKRWDLQDITFDLP